MKPAVKYSIIALVAAILAFLIFYPGQNKSDGNQPVQTQQRGSSNLSVDAYVVAEEEFSETIRTTGNIRSDEEIYLRMEAPGRVISIGFEEGQQVRKGQVLARINAAELEAQKRRAEAQINLAEIRENRQKNLLERRAIAQEDYDTALNELVTLQAQLENIEAELARRVLRAPFDGLIGLRNISEGAMVTTNDIIATLQKIDKVKLDFSIPERYQNEIRLGSKIRFSVQGNGQQREGEIYAREPRIDQSTRTLRLRAIAENPNQNVLPGAFANIEISLRAIPDAIMIPAESLIPEMSGYKVYLYKDGRVISQVVQIGTRTDRRVLITDGLTAGDTVLTTGLLQVRDNMEVNISELHRGN